MAWSPIAPRPVRPLAGRTFCSCTFLAALLLVAASLPAFAQPRARLAPDLAAHLERADPRPVDVIVTARADLIRRLAARHGAILKRRLAAGAVLTVSPASLASLAEDGEAGTVAADALVYPHLDITTQVTGAQHAWAGLAPGLGPTTGAGVGVAVLDSGIVTHEAIAGRVVW